MSLYDRMLNISNVSVLDVIKKYIQEVRSNVPITDRMCMVCSNLIYNGLVSEHILCKIINTKELGLGYEHEFVIATDNINNYLIDVTYEQFLNKGTSLINNLLNDGYMLLDDGNLVKYLNSIPNTVKVKNISINDLFLPTGKHK